ncbi:MAG: ribonuclease H, partial [Parcubacteria group bacterium Gr01-1014_66]
EDISEKIIIYTDGGSRGNPGDAALGVVMKDVSGKILKSYGKTLGVMTNNEAEYQAIVFALQKAKALLGRARTRNLRVEIRADSQLLVRQLNAEYKIEEPRLFPFFIAVWNLKMDFGEVSFRHIPREENREADRLVNEALDKTQGELFDISP